MMGLYLYCVAPRGHAPPAGLTGLDARPVIELERAPFSLWASELDAAPETSLDRVRRHAEVVAASVSGAATPVPMRFGQWFGAVDALERSVEERRQALERALAQVAGTLEFGVRVVDSAPGRRTAPRPASGTAYMEALRRRAAAERRARDRAAEALAALREAVGELVQRERVDALRPPAGLAAVAHLVRREDAAEYGRRVRMLEPAPASLRLVAGGPWAPYSFVA